MQTLSVVIGLFSALWLFLGIIPFFGWVLWPVLARCLLGAITGAFAQRKTGLTINVAVALVAALRLFLGGGLL